MSDKQLRELRKTSSNPTDPEVEDRGDGLFRIYQTEPVFGPRGGYQGEAIVYWPDATETMADAEECIARTRAGLCNLQPSVAISMNMGERI